MKGIGIVIGLVVALAGAAFADDKSDLQDSAKKLSEQKNYGFKGSFKLPMGNQNFSFEGVAAPPDVMVIKGQMFEAAKKGDKARVKFQGQWRDPDDMNGGNFGVRISDAFEPPHARFKQVCENLKEVEKKGEEKVGGVKCRVYKAKVEGDSVKDVLLLGKLGGDMLDQFVDWSAATVTFTFYVGDEDNLLRKVSEEASLSIDAMGNPMDINLETEWEFSRFGEARTTLPKEVKEELGIKDEDLPNVESKEKTEEKKDY